MKLSLVAFLYAPLFTASVIAQDLLWSEEFNAGSQPDPDTWSYDLGTGNNGWGNEELQIYTDLPANAAVADGHLVITARQTLSGDDVVGFTSARIRTQDKLMVKYGTIEARIQVPNLDKGLWPAFWTLGNNFPEVGWPACGELDIMEMGSFSAILANRTNEWVSSTAHWEHQETHAYHPSPPEPLDAGKDLSEDFHVFTMDWTPYLITTFLDGEQIFAIDITPENCTDCSEFHAPHFIILNLAVGGTFTGMRDIGSVTAPFPAEMRVDYVRVYDNGYTEISGSALGAPEIGPAHSGSWYNVDQSGHGFSMEFVDSDFGPLAIVYWYTYDNQGNPIFLLGSGVPDGNRVEVVFESPLGMVYGDFDPDTVSREAGGSGTFEFSDRDHATFSYTPSQFTASAWGHTEAIADLPLVKIVGIPANLKFSTVTR